MHCETTLPGKLLVANVTFKRASVSVNAFMFRKFSSADESFTAKLTGEWPLVGMHPLVVDEFLLREETLVAKRARERTRLAGMNSLVLFNTPFLFKCFPADAAGKRTLFVVNVHVFQKFLFVTEKFFTKLALVWMLGIVSSRVNRQSIFRKECFFAK